MIDGAVTGSRLAEARRRAALVAGAFTLSVSLGTRGSLGLFLAPLALMGFPIGMTAFAIAVNSLVWGAAQPVVGAMADRHGATRIQMFGAAIYAAGFALPAVFPTGWAMMLGIGFLTGVGSACTAFGVSLSGVARAYPPEQRAAAVGLAATGGSIGQMVCPLIAVAAMALGGPRWGLMAMAALVLLSFPLGVPLDRAALVVPERRNSTRAVRTALGNRAFILVTLGFFTCGFQLSFLSTHLPGYLTLCGMPASAGAFALTVVGATNILGSYLYGRYGQRFEPQKVLTWLYVLRAAAILAFYAVPKTGFSTVVFAGVMGLTWLVTVPLTSGVVARLFGVADIGALFGVCFISHQVGSFLGAWSGGLAFAWTGNYDLAFIATAAAGLVAAALNVPIRFPRPAQPFQGMA